ncbi:MAG: desulfoferrodoxin family protein [Eubacteriales bacterium]
MDIKFYVCPTCGNIVAKVTDSGVPVFCCGKKMEELVPNTVEASAEKHIPVIKREGNKVTVTVGSVAHPMAAEHHIAWIALRTKTGNQRKELAVGSAPEACFSVCEGDEITDAYAYCNLHGLWKSTADN